MYLPLLSTRGQSSPQSDAAALETRRRASPFPGAHVVADIRGAAPGNSGPRCGVWVETSREQATKKKTFLGDTAGTSLLFCPLTAQEYASARGGDLCAWTQLVSINSAAPPSTESSFQKIPAHCFVKIFARHLLGFFRDSSRLSARTETLRWLVHLR